MARTKETDDAVLKSRAERDARAAKSSGAAHRNTNRDRSETRDDRPLDPHDTRARHPDRVNPDDKTDSTGFELDMRSLAGRYPDGGEEFDINKDELIRHHLRSGANPDFVKRMTGDAAEAAVTAGPAIPPGGHPADFNSEVPIEAATSTERINPAEAAAAAHAADKPGTTNPTKT